MPIRFSYGDITEETVSVKRSPFPFLLLRESAQVLEAKRYYPGSDEIETLRIIYSWLFHKIFRYPEEEKETYTSEIPIGYKEFYIPSTIIPMVEQKKAFKNWSKKLSSLLPENSARLKRLNLSMFKGIERNCRFRCFFL